MKFLAQITLDIDTERVERLVNIERVIAKAIDYTVEANIDGNWGIDVTSWDMSVTLMDGE